MEIDLFGNRRVIHTLEECQRRAAKYKTRSEYAAGDAASYKAAQKNQWLDLICSHMPRAAGNKSVTVFGVEYAAIAQALAAHGYNPSAGSCARNAKVWQCSVAQALERMVQQRDRPPETKAQQLARIALQKEQEEKEAALRSLDKRFVGPYTRLKPCRNCGKLFNPKRTFVFHCSAECEEQRAQERTKANLVVGSNYRKELRAFGVYPRESLRRRQAKHGGTYDPSITAAQVARRDGLTCQVCGCMVHPHSGDSWQPRGWTVGHIIALADGGHTTWDNVQCECFECNSLKGNKPLGQMRLFDALWVPDGRDGSGCYQ